MEMLKEGRGLKLAESRRESIRSAASTFHNDFSINILWPLKALSKMALTLGS